MNEQESNCPYGPDSDIDARYLAGTLSAEESEAFEEHYFGCDRCFAAVRRGAEIRAALAPAGGSEASTARSRPADLVARRRFSVWQPALAAAAAVLVVLGVRQVGGRRANSNAALPATSIDASRGARTPLSLTSYATTTVLAAAWSPVTTAHSYRVRLLAADGSLLFERETGDTTLMLSRGLVRDKNAVYWEVQALDALRSVVATSPVAKAQTSPGPP